MKLTIKSNGVIRSANVEPEYYYNYNDEKEYTGNIACVELDFEKSSIFSDFEMWLEDDNGKVIDHKAINISNRNKMKMSN